MVNKGQATTKAEYRDLSTAAAKAPPSVEMTIPRAESQPVYPFVVRENERQNAGILHYVQDDDFKSESGVNPS
jgi:hypothetical protein